MHAERQTRHLCAQARMAALQTLRVGVNKRLAPLSPRRRPRTKDCTQTPGPKTLTCVICCWLLLAPPGSHGMKGGGNPMVSVKDQMADPSLETLQTRCRQQHRARPQKQLQTQEKGSLMVYAPCCKRVCGRDMDGAKAMHSRRKTIGAAEIRDVGAHSEAHLQKSCDKSHKAAYDCRCTYQNC